MAAGSVARVLRAPGRLVVGANKAFAENDYPYGGTEVGKVSQVAIQPIGVPFRVQYESLGEVGDVLEANKQYLFGCFLRGWDDDAVQRFLTGGYEIGDETQHAVFHEPGARVPGRSAYGRAIVLTYVPDDQIRVPAVHIYSGIPIWTENAELAFQRAEELGIPISVECLRDSGGDILRIGRLPDLAL